MRKLKNQRDTLVKLMLTGMKVTRLYCVDNKIAWEVSSRMGEIENEYLIVIQRKRVKHGSLNMTEYWIDNADMDTVRGDFMAKYAGGE